MVYKWNVTIPKLSGDTPRRAYIWLPEDYEQNPDKRYPVMYMFDGHNVFFDSDATFGKSWGMAKYMEIQKVYIAPETEKENPEQWKALHEVFPEDAVEWVMLDSHEELKAWEKDCKSVIRTGEITPYSNIILESGVIF